MTLLGTDWCPLFVRSMSAFGKTLECPVLADRTLARSTVKVRTAKAGFMAEGRQSGSRYDLSGPIFLCCKRFIVSEQN
jgi:hypothetical protein